MSDLLKKKCIPCEGGIPNFDITEIHKYLKMVDGWEVKADENKIGMISEVNGVVIAINDELDERDLNVFDPIFSNEEIFTTENSSTTLQFNDDTTIIMKELTSLVVSDFVNSKLDPKFKSKVSKGEVVIETGSFA